MCMVCTVCGWSVGGMWMVCGWCADGMQMVLGLNVNCMSEEELEWLERALANYDNDEVFEHIMLLRHWKPSESSDGKK